MLLLLLLLRVPLEGWPSVSVLLLVFGQAKQFFNGGDAGPLPDIT